MKHILYLLLLLAISISMPCVAQNKEDKERKQEEIIKKQIENRNFKIDISKAIPQGERSVPLSLNSITVRNDSLISDLPYFGRSFAIPYGGSNGLIFSVPIQKMKVTEGKKGKQNIVINVETDEDDFRYNITIFPNGTSNVSVSMQNRNPISYFGRIETGL